MTLIVSPRAKAEAAAATRFYEDHRPGLGRAFISDLDAALARIEQNPHASQRIKGNVRRALLHRFPYCLIYTSTSDEVVVLGIFSTWLDPLRVLLRAGSAL